MLHVFKNHNPALRSYENLLVRNEQGFQLAWQQEKGEKQGYSNFKFSPPTPSWWRDNLHVHFALISCQLSWRHLSNFMWYKIKKKAKKKYWVKNEIETKCKLTWRLTRDWFAHVYLWITKSLAQKHFSTKDNESEKAYKSQQFEERYQL